MSPANLGSDSLVVIETVETVFSSDLVFVMGVDFSALTLLWALSKFIVINDDIINPKDWSK